VARGEVNPAIDALLATAAAAFQGGTALTMTVNLQPTDPLRPIAPLAASRVKPAASGNRDTPKWILDRGGLPDNG
jgi:hypothetical protein